LKERNKASENVIRESK